MNNLIWERIEKKKPDWMRKMGKDTRVEWRADTKPMGSFKIDEVYRGYSLYRSRTRRDGVYNVHIGTFLKIETAKEVAQLIYNG